MSDHAYFMQRALSLAMHGCFSAHPNPMVGCVIVKQGKIVGEGWHQRPGSPHAEIHALQQAGEAAAGADVYVNLEPCNHYGRTPPCVDALIAAKVARVIIPFIDPNPQVNGQGLVRLKQAGIEVIIGIEAEKAWELNRFFLTTMQTGRPYVIAKWAMTIDGQLTLAASEQRWITGEAAREHVHQQRAQVGAILVGANTQRLDKPQLTARLQDKNQLIQQPKRLILTHHPDDIAEHCTAGSYIISAKPAEKPLENLHYLTFPAQQTNDIDLTALLNGLAQAGCLSLIVEGGAQTLAAFLQANLVDELHIYQSLHHSGWENKTSPGFLKYQPGWIIKEMQSFGSDFFIKAVKDV